jgi:hypothetical protein
MELIYLGGLFTSLAVIFAIMIRWWVDSRLSALEKEQKKDAPQMSDVPVNQVMDYSGMIYKVEREIKVPRLEVKLSSPKISPVRKSKTLSFKVKKPKITKKG